MNVCDGAECLMLFSVKNHKKLSGEPLKGTAAQL